MGNIDHHPLQWCNGRQSSETGCRDQGSVPVGNGGWSFGESEEACVGMAAPRGKPSMFNFKPSSQCAPTTAVLLRAARSFVCGSFT